MTPPPQPHASSATAAAAVGAGTSLAALAAVPRGGGATPEAWLSVRAGASPGRRRAALALMEDAAIGRAARVLPSPPPGGPEAEDTLLFGGAPEAVAAAEAALLPLFGPGAVSRLGAPPPAARAAAAGATPAPLGPSSPPSATPGGPFEARLEALPLEEGLARRPVVGVGPAGRPRAAGIRLSAREGALAALAASAVPSEAGGGAAGRARPHLVRHASALLLRRAAGALLGEPGGRLALLGGPLATPLHLDWPVPAAGAARAAPRWPSRAAGGDGDDAPPLLPVLALGAVLAGAGEEAEAAGLPFGVAVAEAAALGWLADPAALPGAVVHLPWGAALASAPAELVARLGPGRVVLEGADEDEALAWGLSRGIGRYVGAAASRLLAAVRRRGCAHGGGCSAAECAARADGLSPAARLGCAVPARLLGEGTG